MPVVTPNRLQRFMSNPRWSPEQEIVAAELCEQVEDSLRAALYDAPITPEPCTEVAPIIDTGQVATTYPVFSVNTIDGAPMSPTDYQVRNYKLHQIRTPALYENAGGAISTGSTFTAGSLTPTSSPRPTSPYVGTVTVDYQAGWGPRPALVHAILRKAAAIMNNRHSDTVVAVGLDTAAPPPPAPEVWDETELVVLGVYRRLGIGGTA